MKEHTCPKCGTPVLNANAHGVTFVAATGVVTYDGRTCRLRPMQIDILEMLLDAFPGGVQIPQLFAELYPNREDDNRRSLAVTVSQMRHHFDKAGIGLSINTRKGWGDRSEYHLVLREAEQEQQAVA